MSSQNFLGIFWLFICNKNLICKTLINKFRETVDSNYIIERTINNYLGQGQRDWRKVQRRVNCHKFIHVCNEERSPRDQYNLLSTPESPVPHCTLEASPPWSLSPGPGGKVGEVHTLVEMRICDCRYEPAARLTRCELWSWVSHSTLSPVLMMQVTPVFLSLDQSSPYKRKTL